MRAYLKDIVVTGKGMFSNEVIVQYYDSHGKVISGFFDKQFVNNYGLEINVIHSSPEQAVVMAPQKGFLEVSRYFVVPVKDILYSGAA